MASYWTLALGVTALCTLLTVTGVAPAQIIQEFSLRTFVRAGYSMSMEPSVQAWLGPGTSVPERNGWRARKLKALWQLCSVIETYTNRGCLLYSDYGCFCGLGGSGTHPLDSVDACCMAHDQCYEQSHSKCDPFPSHLVLYKYSCTKQKHTCQCLDAAESKPCRRFVCDCDLRLSRCLAGAAYHPQNFHANQSRCH